MKVFPICERIAFAAATATRQLNQYEYYAHRYNISKESHPREIALQLWEALQADSTDSVTWTLVLDSAIGLLPEESDDWTIWHALADDALSSLAYAIRTLLTSNPQDATWAARRAYEAVDQAAIRTLGTQPGLPNTEIAIKSHLLVQQELVRQQRDIALLRTTPGIISICEVQKFSLTEMLLTNEEMRSLARSKEDVGKPMDKILSLANH